MLPLPRFISFQRYLINIHWAGVFLNDSTEQCLINGNVAATLIGGRDKEKVASQKHQLGSAEVSGSSVTWQE